jgi:hypothetical protein
MSIWFKDVEDYGAAEAAVRGGMWGALGYAGWVTLNVIVSFASAESRLLFEWLTPLGQFIVIAIIAVQLAVALVTAWRFKLGKGAIAGWVNALVLVAIVGLEVTSGAFHGIIWYVVLHAILMALINGARGAMALRSMHNPDEVVEAFE